MAEIKGGQIVYDIIIKQVSGNNTVLSNTEKSLGSLGKKAQETAKQVTQAGDAVAKSSGGFSRIKDIVASLGIYDLAVKGAQAVVGFFKEASKAADENATSIKKLGQVLSTNGELTPNTIKDLTDMADKYEKLSTATEEQINANSAYLVSQNLSTEQIKQATPALLDLAAGMQTDLAGASDILLNSIQKGSSGLGKYFKNLDEGTLKTFEAASGSERLAIVQGLVKDRFEGSAEASQTFGQKVSKSFGDFQESVGYALKAGLEPLKQAFTGLNLSTVASGENMKTFQKVIYGGSVILGQLIKNIGYAIGNIISMGKVAVGVGKVIYEVFKPAIEVIKGAVGGIGKFLQGDFKGAADSLKDGFGGAFDALKDVVPNTKKALSELGTTALSEGQKIANNIGKGISGTSKAVEEALKQVNFKEVTKESVLYENTLKDQGKELKNLSDNIKLNIEDRDKLLLLQKKLALADDIDIEAKKKLSSEISLLTQKYAPASDAGKNLGNSLSNLKEKTKGATDENKKLNEELTKSQAKLVSVKDEAVKTSKELSETLGNSFKKLGSDISANLEETKNKLAQIVIDAESKKKELQDKLAKGGDDTATIQAELAKVQQTLDARVGYEQRAAERIQEIRAKLTQAGLDPNALNLEAGNLDLQKQIEEAKVNASLNEFQLFEKQQNEKLLKLTNDFIIEATLLKQKIDKQKQFEDELTQFLTSENIKRQQSIEAFATASILKYGQMANSLKDLISLQNQIGAIQQNTQLPQFHDGGYVGSAGGEVHPGEFVVPANIVSQMPELISALDKSRNQTNSIVINGSMGSGTDMRSMTEEMLWKLRRV